ncbi:MAG TPA: hypothetical protein VFL66_13380 [Gaiellaceae bacterium]|nr:hypothetical protein [Gaiellaceae bacterium]
MGRRLLLAALVVCAPLADAAGSHSLAFWSLVAAVGVASVCALASFGTHLDLEDDPVASLQALLWAPANVLLLLAAAARGPAVAAGEVPRLGETALVGALLVLALKLAVWGGARLYRGRLPRLGTLVEQR